MTFIRNVVALAGDGPEPDFHAVVDFAAVAGDDPLASWEATRQLIEDELLSRQDRLVEVRMTPLGVEMPMAMLLTFHGMDPVVHGWDVATATGGSVEIPDDLASSTWSGSRPSPSRFAPTDCSARAPKGGDDPVERLLDFCGRIR